MKRQTLSLYAGGGCGGGDACMGGTCPTVYKSTDGKFYVQGYKVSRDIEEQVTLADNELLVEIDPILIANIVKSNA